MHDTNPPLHLLLKLAAVLGGTFTLSIITPLWNVMTAQHGMESGSLGIAITQAQKLKLLKYLSASGAASASDKSSRRRSSVASQGSRYAFHRVTPPR